jgi:hypothetical protein
MSVNRKQLSQKGVQTMTLKQPNILLIMADQMTPFMVSGQKPRICQHWPNGLRTLQTAIHQAQSACQLGPAS